jgi:23S rRNA (guanosine2251-2'-O)-methyltransferase
MEKKELVLGKNAVREAIAAQTAIQKIFISETLDKEETKLLVRLARGSGIPVLRVPKSKLDRLSRFNHQGVVAITASIPFHQVQNLVDGLFLQGIAPAVAVCDGISDVRNFGAIARSAEVFGLHGLLIGTKNSAPVNSEAIKASSGALMSLPVCREKNLLHGVRQLKDSGLVILCASERANKSVREVDLCRPLAIVLGSEGTGVSAEILAVADEVAGIPTPGKIQSLNVSVAAGILFYEYMLQNRSE